MTTTVTVTSTTVSTAMSHLVGFIDSGGRYVKDYLSAPLLLIGDSPQGMVSDITPTQMETYMNSRAHYGINIIQVHILSGADFGGNSTTFAAQDTTTPFTTEGDISTPREAFFAEIDALINKAADHGMTVMLTAAETADALTLFKNNGVTKCTNFGAYLGNRYKGFPNIVWNYGNDFQTWDSDQDALDAILAVCDGIISADSNHFHTVWLKYYLSASRDSTDWNSRINLDFCYSYYPNYDNTLDEYAKTPAKPAFLGEANYEGETQSPTHYTTTPFIIRKQNYWTMLSGGCGIFYCNGQDTWGFKSGWATRLDTTGVAELVHLQNLLKAYSWWLMVPDSSHAVLTAGYGTYANGTDGSIDTNDYATCSYLASSLAMIYMPVNRTMTVDMSKFSGSVTCKWFDPTDGSYATDAASPHDNSGTHDFSRAGANAAGEHDWVLVLTV